MPARQSDGDLLVGYGAIHAFLVRLGMPENVSLYYLKRAGRWPIGNTHEGNSGGGRLIASKRRLSEYVDKVTHGPPLERHRIVSKFRLGRHTKKTATTRPKRRARTTQTELQVE
jgi:hypothetical protein